MSKIVKLGREWDIALRIFVSGIILVMLLVGLLAVHPGTSKEPVSKVALHSVQGSDPPQVLDWQRNGSISGTRNVLVIMIDFPDQLGNQTQAYYQNLLFGSGQGTLRDYYDEVSYGLLDLAGIMAGPGWYRSANNMTWWGADNDTENSEDMLNAEIFELGREAIVLADADVDFKTYDVNNNSIIDPSELHVCVIHAGSDQADSLNPDDVWSRCIYIAGQGYDFRGIQWADTFVDGCRITRNPGDNVGSFTLLAEDNAMGPFAHEFGHDLGLPDFYNTIDDSPMVGDWSLMDSGTDLDNGNTPGHLDPWCKIQLGWLTPTIVQFPSVVFVNLAESNRGNRVYRINVPGTREYFLIENRQQTGYDTFLPESGIVIWHIDEAMPDNDGYPPRFAVEQPGGSFNTAAYSTNDGQTLFNPTTSPNSNDNNNTPTSVSVLVNSAESSSMKVIFYTSSGQVQVPSPQYPSIQSAVSTAPAGFAVFVSSGRTYSESLSVGAARAIIGLNRDNTIIQATGPSVQTVYIGASNVLVTGFTIQGATNGWAVTIVSNGNCVADNIIQNNLVGIKIQSGSSNAISWNKITGCSDGVAADPSSSGNFFLGNNVTSNSLGLYFLQSHYNTISSNYIAINYNGGGINLGRSVGNNISRNTLKNNGPGIYYTGSGGFWDNNIIYNNNFVENWPHVLIGATSGYNIWDNGYVEGGNYWSDYSGVDLYGGPYQNETGSDGRGDTPVWIDYNKDNYPLMVSWPSPDVAVTNVALSKTVVGTGYPVSINATVRNQGGDTVNTDVTVRAELTTQLSDTGLVSHWKFDEGSGTTASDSSGNNNHGTVYGATWTNGKSEKALSFDGNDYVRIPDSDSLDISGDFTIAAWINTAQTTYGRIFSNVRETSPNNGYSLYVSGGRFCVYSQGGEVSSATTVSTSTWRHVVATLSGQTATIYVDGTLDKNGFLNIPNANEVDQAIGASYVPNYFFQGLIDEVRVYNRSLSAGEVKVLATGGQFVIQTQPVTLDPGASETLSFTWSTLGFSEDNYTLIAFISPILGETDSSDNIKSTGILVTISGDVDGDFDVDILDVVLITSRYMKYVPQFWPGSPALPTDNNCDINGDGVINILDVVLCTSRYGQTP